MMLDLPTKFDDLIISDVKILNRLSQYAKGKRKGNILLYGLRGLGKTETAKIISKSQIPDDLDYEPLIIRSSINSEDFEKKIFGDWNFQKLMGIQSPYVVLDEVDELTNKQQRILRATLDNYQSMGNVVMTTNHKERLDLPLVDRCDGIEMPLIDPTQWLDRAQKYLKTKNKNLKDQSVLKVLMTCDGSIRDLNRAIDDLLQ